MTKKELENFEEKLKKHSYKKYSGHNNADFSYFKSFGKDENPYEEDRSLYQICFSVYDFSKYARRDKYLLENPIGIQVTLMISRIASERIDLDITSDSVSDTDIKKIEQLGESLFKWTEENIKIETRSKTYNYNKK